MKFLATYRNILSSCLFLFGFTAAFADVHAESLENNAALQQTYSEYAVNPISDAAELGDRKESCSCTTKPTGPDGKRHSCGAKCVLTASSGFKLNIRKNSNGEWEGLVIKSTPGNNSCQKSVRVRFKRDSASNKRYPYEVRANLRGRGLGPGEGRSRVRCSLYTSESRL